MLNKPFRILDVSPLVSPSLGVFPGDTGFSREVSMDTRQGDPISLSAITTTLHLGAHADATNHYHQQGEGVEKRELNCYLGSCQVVTVSKARGERILPKDVAGLEIKTSRILFRTLSFPDPNHWNSDFNSLSPELIEMLAAKKVVLVGIDTPSVDPESSKTLESHQAIFRHKLAILEGLVLTAVQDGVYTLVALPLKLQDADASPVRAVLLQEL